MKHTAGLDLKQIIRFIPDAIPSFKGFTCPHVLNVVHFLFLFGQHVLRTQVALISASISG